MFNDGIPACKVHCYPDLKKTYTSNQQLTQKFLWNVSGLAAYLHQPAILCSGTSFDNPCDVNSKVIINVRVIFSTTNTKTKACCALTEQTRAYVSQEIKIHVHCLKLSDAYFAFTLHHTTPHTTHHTTPHHTTAASHQTFTPPHHSTASSHQTTLLYSSSPLTTHTDSTRNHFIPDHSTPL